MPALILIITFILVGTGSASFAAEKALPGNILYPIKVNANEELRLLLAGSKKAEWEAKRLERRLLEAEHLAQKGALDASHASELQNRIVSHAQASLELAPESQADMALELESMLDVHEKVLAYLEQNTPEEESIHVQGIRNTVQSRRNIAAEPRLVLQAQITAKTDGEALEKAKDTQRKAEERIVETRVFLERQNGTEQSGKAQTRFDQAVHLFAEGNVLFQEESYKSAFMKFQEAALAAEQAKLLSTIKQELPFDPDIQFQEMIVLQFS